MTTSKTLTEDGAKAKEAVRAAWPSARPRREGIHVLIVKFAPTFVGWSPLSGVEFSESQAWIEAAKRLGKIA
jgi:phage portal protein BeeE